MADPVWTEQFEHHRPYLRAVCYRMTGDVTDADDLVQATFARALERPPNDLDSPLRPWLTRVASNLAIDLLRRRKHRAYDGPWLPAPIESLLEVDGFVRAHHGVPDVELGERDHDDDPEHHYGQLESARYALLLALELLDPKARAVLILRDVLGYAGPEVAAMLELSPGNVRVLLHRARKLLAERGLGPRRDHDPRALEARRQASFEGLFVALTSGDVAALTQLLAADVRMIADAGGEFLSARNIVAGREPVIALILGITRGGLDSHWSELRELNGELASVSLSPKKYPRAAERTVVRIELDDEGKIIELQLIAATRKLAAVDFRGPRNPSNQS